MAKARDRDSGIPTAPFVVVSEPDDIATVDLPLPLFAKPVAEGTGKGISARSRIETAEDLQEVCLQMLREHRQPVLVETFLPGREFTVGIVGNGKDARALGTLEVFLKGGAEPGAYSYHNKKEYEAVVEYRLSGDGEALRAMDTALASWKALGCRDGGRVDLRSDGRGVPHFVEVNPLAGLHPVHSDLCILAQRVGISYKDLIGGILAAALARYR
jgi:D-alanine-D-alanine ligase